MKDMIESYHKLLPVAKSISLPEAERRAGEFMVAMAKITDMRHILGEEEIKCTSVLAAVRADLMGKVTGKTVSEKEAQIEADPEYVEARTAYEMTRNDLNYLKANYDIFMNGHIFYRTMAKGEAL